MFLMVLKLIHFNQIGVLFRFGHDVCRLRREELDMGSFSTQIHRDHSSALKPAASALAPSLMQAERQSHTHVCVHTHTHTHTLRSKHSDTFTYTHTLSHTHTDRLKHTDIHTCVDKKNTHSDTHIHR